MMKKQFLLVSALLFLLAVGALATDMRVLTMGNNNTILLDEANIWIFPSRINYYPDLAGFELARIEEPLWLMPSAEFPEEPSPMERVGVNFKFGDNKPWVLGLYLHNNVPVERPYIQAVDRVMTLDAPLAERRFQGNKRADIFYGRKLAGQDFGFHFGMVHSSSEGASYNNFNENGFAQYNIDFGATMLEGLLDVAAGVETFTITNIATVDANQGIPDTDPSYIGRDVEKDEGNSSYYIRARYFHEMNPTCTFVPHFGFTTGNFETSYWAWRENQPAGTGWSNVLSYSNETKLTEFELGIGLHYTPSSKLLAVLDFGLMSTKTEWKQDNPDDVDPSEVVTVENNTTVVSLPYFKLGFEAGVFRWMDIRFGAQSFWSKLTTEDLTPNSASKSVARFPDNKTYLGLGFNWGKFHVDTYMDPQLFLNGFDFISGASEQTSGRMNMAISAVYEMH